MGHIALDPAATTPALAIADPTVVTVATAAPALSPATGRVVFVTVPLAARPVDGGAMTAMVTAAIRDIVDRPAPAGAAPPAAGEDMAAPAPSINEVIAAHDARIAVLRRTLATLAPSPGTARLTRDLGQRLRRAEAARQLAMARIDGDPAGRRLDPAAPHATTIIAAVSTVAVAPPRPAAYRRPHVRVRVVMPSSPALWRPARSWSHVAAAHPHGSAAAAPGRSADDGTARHLAAARRSLAIARQALTAAKPTARTTLAGLWRWDGSDRWALAPDRS